MNRFFKMSALSLVVISAITTSAQAGLVDYDFSTGTIGGVAPSTQTTAFDYSQVIQPTNDIGMPNLTATFKMAFGSAGQMQVGPAVAGLALISGPSLTDLAPGANKLAITFNNVVNFGSFKYDIPGDPVGNNYQNNLTIKLFLNAIQVGTTSTFTTAAGSEMYGTYSTGPITPSSFYFNQILIATDSSTGPLTIDDLIVNPVPEIDPASSFGALTLLGSAVVMIRGRRRKNSGD